MAIRTAIVKNAKLEIVSSYLPSNYQAREIRRPYLESYVEIFGVDNHGWTMDGYVIPRLASGLIVAVEEIRRDTYFESEFESEISDEGNSWARWDAASDRSERQATRDAKRWGR